MSVPSASIDVILNALGKLVSSPSEAEKEKPEMKMDKLQSIFRYNIEQMQRTLQQSSVVVDDKDCGTLSDEACWEYVWWNIKLLRLFANSIFSALTKFTSQVPETTNSSTVPPAMSPDTLSFTSQQVVNKSIQFVVGCGICPLLAPGVGLPLDRRTECSEMISEAVSKLRDVDRSVGERRLLTCIDSLMHCCTVSTLATLILPRYLNDLLAATLQLLQRPNSTLNPTERALCEATLQHLIENVSRSVVVKELIVLQNGPPPTRNVAGKLCVKRVPVWLKKSSSDMLRKFIMMPSGVLAVFKALLPELEDVSVTNQVKQSPVSLDWRRCEAVARIVVECPLEETDVRCYYRNIGSQVITLLREDVNGLCRPLLVAAVSLMRTRHPLLTDELVTQEILSALLACVERDEETEPYTGGLGSVIVSGQALESCIQDIHKLFIMNCESHFHLVSALKPIVHVLFCLHCQTLDGISFMRSQVQEIMLWIFTHLELSTSLQYLKQLIRYKGSVLTNQSSSSCQSLKDEALLRMKQNVKFVAADNGGMAVVKCNEMSVEEEVDMMEKSVLAVVEILAEVKRQDDLVTQFFLHCLKDLTILVSSDAKNLSSSQVQQESACIEELDVRRAADSQLKYNMTLLALLGAMCERLGYECLKNSQHIVEFVKATLERAVRILENTDDAEFSSLETETVSMSIGLMTAIIIDENYKSSLDWKHCELLLPLLQTLSKRHYDSEIQDMAMSLQVAIATHGFVKMDNLSEDFVTANNPDKKQNKSFENNSSPCSKLEGLQLYDDNVADGRTIAGSDSSSILENKKLLDPQSTTSRRLIEEISSTDFADGGDDDNTTSQISSGQSSIQSSSIQSCSGQSSSNQSSSIQSSSGQSSSSQSFSNQSSSIQSFSGQSSFSQSFNQSLKLDSKTNVPANDTFPVTPTDEHTTADDNSAFHVAMSELRDPFLPVRGHGLISLRRLIEQNDSDTLNHVDKVLSICTDSLSDSDSYIYLAAVQALSALGERRPVLVLDVVVREYVEGREAELRMKLGEVLVKIVTTLGELVPHHKDRLLNAVLSVIRTSDDELVKASAVSNLGQICQHLHFSIGSCVSEIFLCVHNLLKYESHIEVRRSAAMFASLLLKGLSSDTFKVMNSTLNELYKLLKHTVIVDKDEIVKLHVQLALEELDIIVKDFLFPKASFKKRIHVLDPFDMD